MRYYVDDQTVEVGREVLKAGSSGLSSAPISLIGTGFVSLRNTARTIIDVLIGDADLIYYTLPAGPSFPHRYVHPAVTGGYDAMKNVPKARIYLYRDSVPGDPMEIDWFFWVGADQWKQPVVSLDADDILKSATDVVRTVEPVPQDMAWSYPHLVPLPANFDSTFGKARIDALMRRA